MKPLARKNDLIIECLPNEIVVYDRKRNTAHCLNNPVKWIWEQCDGSATIDDITSKFEKTFGVGNGAALVSSGIGQLAAANLVTDVPPEKTVRLKKITRRDIVALGASVAPIVASIVVPTPAAAQSRGPGGPPFPVPPPKPPSVPPPKRRS